MKVEPKPAPTYEISYPKGREDEGLRKSIKSIESMRKEKMEERQR